MLTTLSDRSYLTAPHRKRLSKSMLYLIRSRKLHRTNSLLDYGCGHGFEWQYLRSIGYDAHGYDPHYFPSSEHNLPNSEHKQFDVVTLLHVLNVIPKFSDRITVLRDAYARCKSVLVVASRSPQPCVGTDYLDGKVTRYGWFNKCYSDLELKLFCAKSLGVDESRFRQIGQKAFILHR
jgi:DNA phosphorothioation-associated putative methyltransferase